LARPVEDFLDAAARNDATSVLRHTCMRATVPRELGRIYISGGFRTDELLGLDRVTVSDYLADADRAALEGIVSFNGGSSCAFHATLHKGADG